MVVEDLRDVNDGDDGSLTLRLTLALLGRCLGRDYQATEKHDRCEKCCFQRSSSLIYVLSLVGIVPTEIGSV